MKEMFIASGKSLTKTPFFSIRLSLVPSIALGFWQIEKQTPLKMRKENLREKVERNVKNRRIYRSNLDISSKTPLLLSKEIYWNIRTTKQNIWKKTSPYCDKSDKSNNFLLYLQMRQEKSNLTRLDAYQRRPIDGVNFFKDGGIIIKLLTED